MDRMGLSWEHLHKLNPRLIFGSVKGFNHDSPWSDLKVYDKANQQHLERGATMDQQVVDNQQAQRFEIYNGDELAGFAEYHLHGNRIALLHTEIAAGFQGRGLGGKLVHHVLDDARHRGLAVLPYCPFIRQWITKHPDYLDLVPETQRAHFDL